MPRNLITRTMKSTEATVMAVNIESAEVFNMTFELEGTYKDENATLKAIYKTVEPDPSVKIIALVNSVVTEQLYAISETDFLKYAHPVTKA